MEVFRGECKFSQSSGVRRKGKSSNGGGTDIKCNSPLLDQITLQYVVPECYPPFKFYFPLFWGMLGYHNDFATRRNKTSASTIKDKIE